MELSSVFKMVALSSATASVIAIIILIVKKLFKTKINVTWQYYIWFLLIIRLIVPSGFETPLSKFNMVVVTERVEISQSLLKNSNDQEYNTQNSNKVSKAKTETKSDLKETKDKDFKYYFNIASIVWIIGVVLASIVIFFINGLLFVKVNKQPICKEPNTMKVFEKCKSIMKISKFIPIVYDRYVGTPALFGLIKPKVLINPDLINKLSFEEKKFIFLHELSHFRRKDVFTSWVMIFCGVVNWFNPIIWFSFHKMWEDCELACDAYVLSHLENEEQKQYGKTIISLASFVSRNKWIPGTTGIINSESNIKRRIIMIKNFKRTSYKWTAIPICILVALGMVGITNSPTKATTLKNEENLLQAKENKENYVNIVKEFLPKNSHIAITETTKEVDNVFVKDLDNDGRSEIISAYKLDGENEKINIIALKKVGKSWTKILDEPIEGYKIESVITADIDGDGKDEVLISKRLGGTLAQLSVYKLKDNLLNKISNEDVQYSKLDILSIPGKNSKAISTWMHDTGEAYKVDVLKWDGKAFVPAQDSYDNYFKQSVVPYYEQKVKTMPEARFYWYYLADAQIKAKDKKAALQSIEKGLSLNKGYPSTKEFNKLKEKVVQ
ncbi:M56 family metallopeptidase [Clostridium sp. JS66]|uniref:M56 family metallopeptidase n=1 Tax=Clostridium sp. JS66 TaxID=3064705 RepID=UPI00298E290E|nr:M56 family metallopeptidase [Clostridium sp. JS66]WPC44410.1 M56 family metallopeptidase [Clostridium sp. JS66]